MGDSYLSVCPADPHWQPTPEVAARLEHLMHDLVPDAEEIEVIWSEKVHLVEAGENLERITCPVCRGSLDIEWWADLQEEAFYRDGYDDLWATAPCCGERVALNELAYDWPQAYARFEVAAMNPDRGWFTEDEMSRLTQVLGHQVRQVIAQI